jgi:hypothetical protein
MRTRTSARSTRARRSAPHGHVHTDSAPGGLALSFRGAGGGGGTLVRVEQTTVRDSERGAVEADKESALELECGSLDGEGKVDWAGATVP